jgi:SAM-dependent methyltransferase
MAKRKDDAVVKTKSGAGKKGAKAKASSEAKPARTTKAAGRTTAAAAEPSSKPAKAKAGKAGKVGKAKTAAPAPEVVAEPPSKPAKAKTKTKTKAKTKAGKQAKAAAPAPEVVAEPPSKPAKSKAKSKAGKQAKTAAPAPEVVADPPKAAKAKAKTKAKAGKKAAKVKETAAPTLAERLDVHDLYQRSVQSPEADLEFFVERYKELRGREPKVLREDFCGTAYISATWASSGKGRRAIGVDLDAATLAWAREHNLAPLSKDANKRVDLRQANVLDGDGVRADVTCAMNFSYGVFKTRAELRHYLEVVYQQLADDGVFVTELYGGTEAIVAVQDEREIEGDETTGGDFTYLWEQAAYNPITHETLCHINFRLSDGSTIEKAFTYDWRLWSIAELREVLYEVGFQSVRVYWEATDEDGDGTGEYYPTEQEENQESWLVYLVAAK